MAWGSKSVCTEFKRAFRVMVTHMYLDHKRIESGALQSVLEGVAKKVITGVG